MPRSLVSVLLAVLVVSVAGCTGPDVAGDGTHRFTDSTATDTTDSVERDEERRPSGITDSGVNASAVVAAHERALRDRSVTVVAEWHAARSDDEDSIRLETYASGSRDSYLHRYRYSYRYGEVGGSHNETSYLHDGFVYRKIDRPMQNVSYHLAKNARDVTFLLGVEYVNETLSSATFAPAERQNGSELVTLRATAADLPPAERENVTSYNATVRIDSAGIVRSIEINSTSVDSGSQVEVRHVMRVTDVGTTEVPDPSWFDEARSTLPEPIAPPDTPGEEFLGTSGEFESGSVVSHELGAAASLVGSSELIETATVSEWGHAFAQEPLPYAVSTPVEIRADAPAEAATIKLRYDESAIPDGDESGLAIYRFNHTIQTFVPLESSVDAANDTVTASGRDVLDEYEYVEDQHLSAFAVFHVASWEAMWETEAPSEEGER